MVSVSESKELFKAFGELQTKFEDALNLKNVDLCRSIIQEAQTSVSMHASYLPARDLQTYKERIDQFKKDFDSIKAPRKKFQFSKATKQANDKAIEAARALPPRSAAGDQSSKTLTNLKKATFSLTDKQGETLCLEDVYGEVELCKLTDCKVRITGNPMTLYISDLINCEVVCDPVTSSVLIVGFVKSVLESASQQMRIHKAIESSFWLHVTSRSIIEDCSELKFGPLRDTYPSSDEVWSKSGLKEMKNNYASIDDFNWLNCATKSPNFTVVGT